MHKLYYQVPGTWFGDCMPFGENGKFYLYYLKDTRNPVPFGEPFGWDLICTSDFVNYEDLGVAITHGTDEEPDQYVFSGSVLKTENKYHAFYTGNNFEYPNQGKPGQILMHAVSDDALNWEKDIEFPLILAEEGYDPDDWRDPFVLWDEEHKEYLMLLGARLKGPKTRKSGRTVKYTSNDLTHWDFKGDFWAPNLYNMHEMPDLFKIGKWWYHIITEYSDKSKMIYRMSCSLNGPWLTPEDDAFDGRAYYAGRTYCMNGKRFLFGWVPTKENENDKQIFQWAGTLVVHEIFQRADGTLGVKIPESVWRFFDEIGEKMTLKIDAEYVEKDKVVCEQVGDLFALEAEIKFSEDTSSFGIRLYENEDTEEAYQFHFYVKENRVIFEKTPNWPWPSINNEGLERPILLEPNKIYNVRIIVDDTIATLYVNGVALNARMYESKGNTISFFSNNGTIEVSNLSVNKHKKY